MTDDDLPLLHRWLNEPGVVRWWEGDDVSWAGVVDEYSEAAADPHVEYWLALVGGREVGWAQLWPTADEPDEVQPWWDAGVARASGSIDYLVGEPGDRRRGVGSAMIRAFVRDVAFPRHPQWVQVAVAPLAANTASWRALEKAGFRFLAEVPDRFGPARLMVIDRP
jgi:aminoglycoside 6'-N-acetyltransferase